MLQNTPVTVVSVKSSYRPDIDGLRAVAVLAVILYHAFPNALPGGFVGVDVFFVISGYLISGNIFSHLERRDFSFRDFYARRICRIFPALIVVLVACLVFGWFSLLASEYIQLGTHVAAGAAFLSNFVLWQESGYFDVAALNKPLLHLWSLGIEEQFYLVWPVALWAAWRARAPVRIIIAAIIIGSFALNIYATEAHPVFAFYSPFTRFWELLMGAGLAWWERRNLLSLHQGRIASWIGAALLCAGVLVITPGDHFPGWWALLPVLGTTLLISAGPLATPNRILSRPAMVFVGLISYPLYLWHWPLLAFPRMILETVPIGFRLAALAASLLLAWATYSLVERPIRFGANRARKALALLVAMAIVGSSGFFIQKLDGFQTVRSAMVSGLTNLKDEFKWPYAQNATCLDRYPYDLSEVAFWFCAASKNAPPEVLLIGNSFANDLFPGLAEDSRFRDRSILNIGACLPAMNVDWDFPTMMANHPCSGIRKANDEKFISALIEKNKSIKLAILQGFWPDFDTSGTWVNHAGATAGTFIEATDDGTHIPSDLSSLDIFMTGLEKRIDFLEKHNIQTVVFLPKPELAYSVTTCFARPMVTPAHDCIADRRAERDRQATFRNAVMSMAKRHPKLKLFDPYTVWCPTEKCPFIANGRPLLRDDEHLSRLGSVILGREFATWAESELPAL